MQRPGHLLCFWVIITLLSACSDELEGPADLITIKPLIVKTVSLASEPLSYTVESFGQLTVADIVNIGVESAGTVTQVNLVVGQLVKVGDVLFTLDTKKQTLRLEQSSASVDEAQIQRDQSMKTLQRFQSLHDGGAVSEDQLVQAESDSQAASARFQQSQSQLDIAKTELIERTIISAVNGIVASESVEIGQYVQTGTVLATLQAEGAMQVSTYVNEREIVQLTPGLEAQVMAVENVYPALVESIGQSASSTTGNYEIKLRIKGQHSELREGMSAQIALPVVSRDEVIMIPRSAVVDRNRKQIVMVMEGQHAVATQVQFGLPTADRIPVLSGLNPGQQLIIEPMHLVTDGISVVLGASE
jgi:RND family efflux transporter MFP subunit